MSSNLFIPKGPAYSDLDEKLRLEARNGVIQAEFISYTTATWPSGQKVAPELLLKLQQLAVNQI